MVNTVLSVLHYKKPGITIPMFPGYKILIYSTYLITESINGKHRSTELIVSPPGVQDSKAFGYMINIGQYML